MRFRGGLIALSLAATLAQPVHAATPTHVSISFSGDVLAHNVLYLKARTSTGYDFGPQLKGLRWVLKSDINICHLETPLSTEPAQNYPAFATPKELATALKSAGFDGCSVASNHSFDQGVEGVTTTYKSMHAAGLETSGSRLKQNDSAIAWYTVNGVTIAHLAYSYGFNSVPDYSKVWMVNRIQTATILSAAKSAREHGAKIVIVSLHWGTEYNDRPSSLQRAIAKELTASPNIDAIVGHHAHVIQYAAMVNGKPVIYGLGNLWSGQGPWAKQPTGQQGVVTSLEFDVNGKRASRVVSTSRH